LTVRTVRSAFQARSIEVGGSTWSDDSTLRRSIVVENTISTAVAGDWRTRRSVRKAALVSGTGLLGGVAAIPRGLEMPIAPSPRSPVSTIARTILAATERRTSIGTKRKATTGSANAAAASFRNRQAPGCSLGDDARCLSAPADEVRRSAAP
jgi:hypothetical protein